MDNGSNEAHRGREREKGGVMEERERGWRRRKRVRQRALWDGREHRVGGTCVCVCALTCVCVCVWGG